MTMTKECVFAQARKGELWAGNLIPGHTGDNAERLVNTTPIDNSPIGHIQAGTAADMDAAVAVARTGFESGEWSALSPAQRKLVMLRWADLMQAHFEELAALDCVDAGKPITECLNTDMPATIEKFRWDAGRSDEHT